MLYLLRSLMPSCLWTEIEFIENREVMVNITFGSGKHAFGLVEDDVAVRGGDASDAVDGDRTSEVGQVASKQRRRLVTPGEVITREAGYMRGHGTHVAPLIPSSSSISNTDGRTLVSSVAGFLDRVDRLLSVVPPARTGYVGAVGDVVVGRVVAVAERRWKVHIQSRLNASLPLSSVNLPGGELRRRSSEDALTMRNYLVEGDLISAEVQKIQADGLIILHTRSLRYGKLGQGTLVHVPASLVRRRKSHFHRLTGCGGVGVIIGNNGMIWIQPGTAAAGTVSSEADSSANYDADTTGGGSSLDSSTVGTTDAHLGGFVQDLSCVCAIDREAMARTRNCLTSLATAGIPIWDASIVSAYDASVRCGAAPAELLCDDVGRAVADAVRQQLMLSSV